MSYLLMSLVLGCAGSSKSGSGGDANDQGGSGSGNPSGSGGRPASAPAGQGAFIVTLSSGMDGKMCPSGASSTFDVPPVLASSPVEVLSSTQYLHWVANGDGDSSVDCSVRAGSSSFTFSGRIASGARVLDISGGVVDGQGEGSASITVADGARLASALSSPPDDCMVKAVSHTGSPQVKSGSMWATFACASLEHPPSDGCAAKGTFVLENCAD